MALVRLLFEASEYLFKTEFDTKRVEKKNFGNTQEKKTHTHKQNSTKKTTVVTNNKDRFASSTNGALFRS
jgi:hypothetical protein